ncbi:ABC transporter permease [Silvimonas sp. JCM 19000]
MTTTVQNAPVVQAEPKVNTGFWAQGWRRLKRDKVALISLWIVAIYLLIAVGGWLGLIGDGWREQIAEPYAPPSWVKAEGVDTLPAEKHIRKPGQSDQLVYMTAQEDPLGPALAEAQKNVAQYTSAVKTRRESLPFGADLRGRDVITKTIKGTSTSVFVGVFAAISTLLIGTVLGAFSGYFGGKVDDFLNWFYNVFTSVPDMLLLLSFSAVAGPGLKTIICVMALTSWTGTYRLVRAEYLKLKSREYVQAASAIGASDWRRMFIHILPNISHLLLVQFSLLTVAMIKYEAILSFLGFGVGVTEVSLGSMLAEAPAELVQGVWWQMIAVTLAMSVLVTAFSLLIDGLRDALDPKAR